MRPIGVFDSGVGGLTVVAALRRRLPRESIVYLGDTARLPYGTKSAATVARYTASNVEFLLDRDVRAVVVACNTASALALDTLEAPVPLWGVVEPGADLAARTSRGRVGIVATESTIASGAYSRALLARRDDLEIVAQSCPLFVPLVEEGWCDDPITRQIAERYLEPLLAAEIDTLVLGCTHYPLLAPLLQEIVGPEIRLVDSAEAVAEVVARELEPEAASGSPGVAAHRLFVTDGAARFERLADWILGERGTPLELVDVASAERR
ncbi:MAG: glutamate racemase [Thermoanaerobaculia bacterium]|nr:glutamate racemase [Thermoanaerobaculia bacterium]